MADMSLYGSVEYDTAVAKHAETKVKLEKAMEKWELAEEELDSLMN